MRKHLGIEFVYEDESASTTAPPLDGARLAQLPEELKEQLVSALATLDMKGVDATIELISHQDPILGQALKALAKVFEYRPIIDLLGYSSEEINKISSKGQMKRALG